MRKKGFTLIEMLVYVAIVSIVVAITIPFVLSVVKSFNRIRAKREVATNIQVSLDYMIREVKEAKEVYLPTSVLESNPGQLSLITGYSLPADEAETYIDFYLDEGQLYVKREGQDPFSLISPKVAVSNLVFTRLVTSNNYESVKIDLKIDYNPASPKIEFQTSQSLSSSASLRGEY